MSCDQEDWLSGTGPSGVSTLPKSRSTSVSAANALRAVWLASICSASSRSCSAARTCGLKRSSLRSEMANAASDASARNCSMTASGIAWISGVT